MGLDEIFLAILLIGGLVVGFLGINLYRYAVIIMSSAGGYALGNMVCKMFFDQVAGEGVLHDSSSSAIDSFVIAVFVIVGGVLGYALYNVMGPVVGAVGGAFMFAKGVQAVAGVNATNAFLGVFIGIVIGAGLGVLAVKFNGWAMIIFTALAGARITGYAGAYFLHKSSIAATLAKPTLSMFSANFPTDAIRMALFLELFVILTVLGIVVQSILRDD